MYYDSVYKSNPNFCGQKPNKLLIEVLKRFPKGKEALDLGCGQGQDSFYMARRKINVTAVDNSSVAISQIKERAIREKFENIEAIHEDIVKFKIEPNRFSIINCHNVLQFLTKRKALTVIKSIKKNILPTGFITIKSFTKNNPPSKRRKCQFESEEMKKIFSCPDFKIVHYFEGPIKDSGHIGQLEPHKHEMVEIIAQKI